MTMYDADKTRMIGLPYSEQEVKVIEQKAPHGGPSPVRAHLRGSKFVPLYS